jgi:hypothetical protein
MYVILEYVSCVGLVVLMAALLFTTCVAFTLLEQGVVQLASMVRRVNVPSSVRSALRDDFGAEPGVNPLRLS